ncbi:MAG TPA: potassium channel family protein [Kineosporiaceae bacterium]
MGSRRPRARGPAQYSLVFTLLLLSYLLSASLSSAASRVMVLCTYLGTLLLALGSSGLKDTTIRGLRWAVVAGTVAAEATTAFISSAAARGLVAVWMAVVLVVTWYIVVWGVLHHRIVTLQTVFGALSAYLLIGFAFTALFAVVSTWASGSFFAGGQPANTPNLQYFSFVTLTTTGYGDFVAAGSGERSLAVLEALMGQIFLVTLVARLVALIGTTRQQLTVEAQQHSSAADEGENGTPHPPRRTI